MSKYTSRFHWYNTREANREKIDDAAPIPCHRKIFSPNNKDNIAREEPISLKKLRKIHAAWSTQKVVLGWAIDTMKQVLTLPAD